MPCALIAQGFYTPFILTENYHLPIIFYGIGFLLFYKFQPVYYK